MPPQYIFNGNTPKSGENYRAALARDVTGDFQFARAAVNNLWAYFFGQGIVDPPDSFDPARLDPNNPPPSPWTLQPSNAKLLNALATHFIQSGYDVMATMREIVNSNTYQLSSRYPGNWSPTYQNYFARKYVRRLWGEEIADAITQSAGTFPTYNYTGFTDSGYAQPTYMMQLPDVVNAPSSGGAGQRLRVSGQLPARQPRRPAAQAGWFDSAGAQPDEQYRGGAGRLTTTGANASQLLVKNLSLGNTDLINTLFLNVLSRYPTPLEMVQSLCQLGTQSAGTGMSCPAPSNRTIAVQDLLWSLYNKVDFCIQLLTEEDVMSNEQEKCNCAYKKYGYQNKTFFNRPHWTRRQFFQLAGAGVTGSFLTQRYAKCSRCNQFRDDHQKHGTERDLHSAGRGAQSHRYV